MARDRVLPFIRQTKERLEVDLLLASAKDENYKSLILLGQDHEGMWYFKSSSGISKVNMLGMLEFLKMDLFASVGQPGAPEGD